MERLNTLGSSLPPEQPPTNQVIESLSSELSQEFKLAANAVTKLYRVANERNSLLKHQGYLQCLEDILSIMGQNPSASADVIHLWCLKQRNEMLSHGNGVSPDSPSNTNSNKFDFNFDNPNVSNVNNTDVSVPKFRLSNPPPSVEHTPTNYKPKKTRWVRRQPTWAKEDKILKEDGSVGEEQRLPHRKPDSDKAQEHYHCHPHHHHHHYHNNSVNNTDQTKMETGIETDSGPKKKQRLDRRDSIGD
ncbi:hypothetical protein ZYGR_0AV01870 [Zygosaccharomyces rouxii]|uniref:YJR056C-like protein n=1 Tax=Zygosaccharomyces rouxii TaxID=4956 RepID=A0A1Q3AIQ8_ZYGRO|nr:hypothetical protein ZYGR_0AV01870 [Zygosaccharomyces rouxii]